MTKDQAIEVLSLAMMSRVTGRSPDTLPYVVDCLGF